jgi:hypothetical protein
LPQITRSNLFYNKYQYKITTFRSPGAYILRDRAATPKTYTAFLQKYKVLYGSIKNSKLGRFTSSHVKKIVKFYKNHSDNSENHRLNFTHNIITLFTNDLTIANEFLSIDPKSFELTEIVGVIPEVMYFSRTPKHCYRLYLRASRIDEENREELKDFLKINESNGNVFPSNLLRFSIDKYRYLSGNSYYFDYENESIATMFRLLFPALTYKIFKLEKRPQ